MWVISIQGFVVKEHLGDQAEGTCSHLKVDVGCAHLGVRGAIGAGLDRPETVCALRVGDLRSEPFETWIKRRRACIARMAVSARRICLPDLDFGTGDRSTFFIGDGSTQMHVLPLCRASIIFHQR